MTFTDVMYLFAALGAAVLFLPALGQALVKLARRVALGASDDETGANK